jgi:hypothetical protein
MMTTRGTECDGRLARRRWTGEQDGASRYPSRLDHLENHAGCFAGFGLADHALCVCAWLESVVEAEAADVRVCAWKKV